MCMGKLYDCNCWAQPGGTNDDKCNAERVCSGAVVDGTAEVTASSEMECTLGAIDDYLRTKAALRPEELSSPAAGNNVTNVTNDDTLPGVLNSPTDDSASRSKTPAIAGGVAGGVVVLILLVGVFVFYQKQGGEDSTGLVEASGETVVDNVVKNNSAMPSLQMKRVIENPLYDASSNTD